MTWEEWLNSRAAKRETLRRYACSASSRRTTSFNSSERLMRAEFGGARIPNWAREKNSGDTGKDNDQG